MPRLIFGASFRPGQWKKPPRSRSAAAGSLEAQTRALKQRIYWAPRLGCVLRNLFFRSCIARLRSYKTLAINLNNVSRAADNYQVKYNAGAQCFLCLRFLAQGGRRFDRRRAGINPTASA